MKRYLAAISLAMSGWVSLACASEALPFRIETVATGLDHPWSIAFLPDGSQLVTERAGRLRLIEHGQLREAPVSGVPPVLASGQGGLLDVALDPEFATHQWLYLSYAHGEKSANALRVSRARYVDGVLHDVEPIFTAQPLKHGDVHYGGRLAFLADATLVVTVGEGFILREQAQRLDNHFGKLVRIARDGSVPSGNPFVGRGEVRPEIYSYGHRNPQGLVYDAQADELFQHEHGPRGGDELNRIEPGRNYGWPLATRGLDYTGARVSPWTEYPDTVTPLLDWTPSVAPSGMTLYRGAMFPAWDGSLFVSTLVEKSVRRINLRNGLPLEQETLFGELGERLRDVRTAPDGALWLLTDSSDGRVLRVVPATPTR